ncbi:MAG: AAA family ATPase [Oscillospiraceae bacterium]|nr:AAA family ATPase [Oscillospiraceae bacterium]
MILKGVRQAGKTWVLREFGRRYYETTAYFNFDESPDYRQFFGSDRPADRAGAGAEKMKIAPRRHIILDNSVRIA